MKRQAHSPACCLCECEGVLVMLCAARCPQSKLSPWLTQEQILSSQKSLVNTNYNVSRLVRLVAPLSVSPSLSLISVSLFQPSYSLSLCLPHSPALTLLTKVSLCLHIHCSSFVVSFSLSWLSSPFQTFGLKVTTHWNASLSLNPVARDTHLSVRLRDLNQSKKIQPKSILRSLEAISSCYINFWT